MFRRILGGMVFDLVRNALNKIAEMFVEHAMCVQVLVHAVSVAQGTHRSAKKDSVKPRQDTDDTISMSFDETFHVIVSAT